jgi:hypothetical protein
VALLVHLDRVDRRDGARGKWCSSIALAEALAELADARREDVREADQHREVETAMLEVVHQLLEIDRGTAVAARSNLDVAEAVDRDEARAPSVNVVEIYRILDRPSRHRASVYSDVEPTVLLAASWRARWRAQTPLSRARDADRRTSSARRVG